MATNNSLVLSSLRGGLNSCDPPISIDDDQCVLVENIDYERSLLGGKRRGQIAVTTSGVNTGIYFLHRHFPSGDPTLTTLWLTSVSGTSSIWAYKDTAWHTVSPTDALAVTSGEYAIRGQSLHGKLFLAYPLVSGTDRLMVYDGSTLRRTGLAEPAAPNVVTSGSGSFATTRYYRVRYAVTSPSLATRFSEPSDVTTFAPPGTGEGATITKPASIGEGEQFWNVEESINNADFYVIATVAVGTTTYVDENTSAQVTGGTYALSPPIGTYSLQYSPKFLLADADRLVIGGSWQQPALASRVSWTPVYGATGFGNDERLDENEDPFVDLDGYDGGELTDMGGPTNGYMYAFKLQRIFKLIRTGNVRQAYQAIKVTSSKGAMKRSVVSGLDQFGSECLYFLDLEFGPSRIGLNGVEDCGADLTGTWATVNKDAALVSHGVFYPKKKQVHWFVATDGASTPNLRLVAYVKEFAGSNIGAKKGWSTYTGTGQEALCSCLYASNINDNTARDLDLRPFTGHAGSNLVRINDSGTTDVGTTYRARSRTKPFALEGMIRRMGIRAAALVGPASSGVSVNITMIPNFRTDLQKTVTVSLTPDAGEDYVTKQVDDCSLNDAKTMQIELGDAAAIDADWVIDQVAFLPNQLESM